MDVLPSSLAKTPRGLKYGVPDGLQGTIKAQAWVPVFCANCGVPYGSVPQESCTFACWLCNKCAETYGQIAGTMMMPDEVFWLKCHAEMMEKWGRLLTNFEVLTVAESRLTPLSKLLREGV